MDKRGVLLTFGAGRCGTLNGGRDVLIGSFLSSLYLMGAKEQAFTLGAAYVESLKLLHGSVLQRDENSLAEIAQCSAAQGYPMLSQSSE